MCYFIGERYYLMHDGINDTHLFNARERFIFKSVLRRTVKFVVVGSLALCGIASAGIIYALLTVPRVIEPSNYPIPATVAPIIERLGIDQTLISHVRIDTPVSNSLCTTATLTNVGACFHPGTVPVLIVPAEVIAESAPIQNITIGHEYLHYIWSTMSQADKDELTPYIEQVYQSAKLYLDKRIAGYDFVNEGKDSRVNELHSYIGTEISSTLIPQPLLDHYNKYLPNRAALPALFR